MTQTRRAAPAEVHRLDGATRIVHWVAAALVLTMVVTGTILYVGQLEAMVGRRALLARVHVWSGIALVALAALTAVARPVTAGLRAELADLGRWTPSDRRWLRARTRTTPAGKYNGGQKAATAAIGALLLAQVLTGSVMHWNEPFPDAWRTGATFVHDWAYLGLAALIIGHVVRAIGEPPLLHAIVRGSVPRWWAEKERPGWLAEVDDSEAQWPSGSTRFDHERARLSGPQEPQG
ncbi:MAG: cytochrome b/b6 domain-containing protein [Acidimicrobiales bacterium]